MEKMDIRTDLALESREKFERDDVEIPGVKIREKHNRADYKQRGR